MSHAITREQLIGNLNWRYATKQFDPARKISPQDWAALEESIILTPSSFGLQPIAAVVVNDSAVKEKLVAASYNQRQVADASHLVVFSIKTNVTEADVIFVDINGVGLELSVDQGLGLASALKRKYPNKKIVIYSAETTGDRFHQALREVDFCL